MDRVIETRGCAAATKRQVARVVLCGVWRVAPGVVSEDGQVCPAGQKAARPMLLGGGFTPSARAADEYAQSASESSEAVTGRTGDENGKRTCPGAPASVADREDGTPGVARCSGGSVLP